MVIINETYINKIHLNHLAILDIAIILLIIKLSTTASLQLHSQMLLNFDELM